MPTITSRARFAALATLLTLAATPAFAQRLYTLQYKAAFDRGRFAFDVAVVHAGSGKTVMKSTLRTRPQEWGLLETGHAGRSLRLRVFGHANGYAELVLEVREQNRVLQRDVYKYTARAAAPPVVYRGERISLHLRNAELRDVLLAFAEIAHTNIAVDPNVTGTVTLDLVDVPWDQALDLILTQHGLARQAQGGIHIVRRLP